MTKGKYDHYASRWHMLNFKGTSFADIAKSSNVPVGSVAGTVNRYRKANGFKSPEDVIADSELQRNIPGLTAPERKVMALIVEFSNKKQSTSLRELRRALGKREEDLNPIIHKLNEKEYIELRKFHGGFYAYALLEPDGKPYTGESEAHYTTDKNGVKHYTRPMYAEGYGLSKFTRPSRGRGNPTLHSKDGMWG